MPRTRQGKGSLHTRNSGPMTQLTHSPIPDHDQASPDPSEISHTGGGADTIGTSKATRRSKRPPPRSKCPAAATTTAHDDHQTPFLNYPPSANSSKRKHLEKGDDMPPKFWKPGTAAPGKLPFRTASLHQALPSTEQRRKAARPSRVRRGTTFLSRRRGGGCRCSSIARSSCTASRGTGLQSWSARLVAESLRVSDLPLITEEGGLPFRMLRSQGLKRDPGHSRIHGRRVENLR